MLLSCAEAISDWSPSLQVSPPYSLCRLALTASQCAMRSRGESWKTWWPSWKHMPQSVLEQKRNSELLYVDTVSTQAVGGHGYCIVQLQQCHHS